jgi:APA family basic amino acid/polyamine antiporter
MLQNVISLIKVVLVLLLAVAAGTFLWGSIDVLQTNLHQPFAGSTPFGFGLGTVAALWAFAGGGDIVYLAEEMKNPAKDIPHSTIGGISLVAVIYVGPT